MGRRQHYPAGSAGDAQPSQTIASRLRSIPVESHFEAREWRLRSAIAGALDHGLLLQSGEAWLHAGEERRHVLGPAFVWSPAQAADRLVIEAGGSGHMLQIRRDLMEQTFRQIPEVSESSICSPPSSRWCWRRGQERDSLSRDVLIASELRAPGPAPRRYIVSARELGSSALAPRRRARPRARRKRARRHS